MDGIPTEFQDLGIASNGGKQKNKRATGARSQTLSKNKSKTDTVL